VYRADRSYAWNYSHAPTLPRIRRLPPSSGLRLFGRTLDSPLGIASGPLLNSKWIEGYARLGFDVLTYATVRTRFQSAHTLPNIRHVENQEHVAVAGRRAHVNGSPTLAVSLGSPSMEPDVWRRDVRRARERIGAGQMLVVSVLGTPDPDGDAESLIEDYAQCAGWAAAAGADVVEAHLATPSAFGDSGHMIYESIPLSAQILYRIRTRITVPLVAKLGPFRTPRALHDTATKLAPWIDGFALVHSIHRRVITDEGAAAFEGSGREAADVVGAATFPVASRQVEEMLAWRKAGAWPHEVFAVGGITSVERAVHVLREGANVALVATAALCDPLFAARFRRAEASAA
jgi:dihydroorotate dehydrogenase